jgi:hypothetical protein
MLKKYVFTATQTVYAESEEEAKNIFADDSLDFAASAGCAEAPMQAWERRAAEQERQARHGAAKDEWE